MAMSKVTYARPSRASKIRLIYHTLFGIDLSNRHGYSCGNTLDFIQPLSPSETVLPSLERPPPGFRTETGILGSQERRKLLWLDD